MGWAVQLLSQPRRVWQEIFLGTDHGFCTSRRTPHLILTGQLKSSGNLGQKGEREWSGSKIAKDEQRPASQQEADANTGKPHGAPSQKLQALKQTSTLQAGAGPSAGVAEPSAGERHG